jgi:hypothetical protein
MEQIEYNNTLQYNICNSDEISHLMDSSRNDLLTSSPHSASYEQVVNVQSTLIFLRKTD